MTGGNFRKKFQGWFFQNNDRYSAFLGSLVGLRQPAHVVTRPSKEKKVYLERIVYVGCIHGGNEDIYDRLNILTKYPPDYLIFAGDITGSSEIEHLKKHFYDEKEKNPQSPYAGFPYFGDWAARLPKAKREALISTLPQNAKRLLAIIQKIKKQGTKVYIVEGNWDNHRVSGIKTIAGGDITSVFDTQKFFKTHGFSFINKLKTLQTKTTLHIFLPYITLLHFDSISGQKIREVERKVAEIRSKSKTVIMVGHAEANWQIHHLNKKNIEVSGERRIVIKNFGHAMALFQPDEVIYPHQHARIRDEQGNLVDVNAKYLLRVTHDGVRLVDNPDIAGDSKQIVAVYVPLGFLAEEDFIGF